ncbi:MAG: type II secretion system protein [Acidimicrobiia bacterium]
MIDAVRAYRRRLAERDEHGFTLIELMVVVLIIAILLLIAIPQFLSAQQGAQKKAAQSNLRTAAVAAKSVQQDTGSYTMTVADLNGREKDLSFVASATKVNQVVIASSTADTITFYAFGENKVCYGIRLKANAATQYARGNANAPSCTNATAMTSPTGAADASGTTPDANWSWTQREGWK